MQLLPGFPSDPLTAAAAERVGQFYTDPQLPDSSICSRRLAARPIRPSAHHARVLLDHGFTSAYSAGSRGQRFEVALRNEIDAGYLRGPRLRASSQETSGSRATGLRSSHDTRHERTPQGLREALLH